MKHNKNMTAAPLKAKSLSELRNLQRQASKHTASGHRAEHSPDPAHGTPADPPALPAGPRKRRPHRFLPPGPGSGSRAAAPSADAPAPARHTSQDAPVRDVFTTSATTPSGQTPHLDADDAALFRRVVQSVTPVTQSGNRALLPPVPPASPAQLEQRRQHAMGHPVTAPLDVSDQYIPVGIDHDDTAFLQAGQSPHLLKGLKKGQWPAQATLDLHGSSLDEARERLDRFIQTCRDHEIRGIRIVHGKGYGSKDGDPVLKETVRRWLSQLAVVQAYVESDEANGGAGAVLVLLSKLSP